MTFNDINRQKAWIRQVQLYVESVGLPQETQYGYCQAITATDTRGLTECINYFFDALEFAVDESETGNQWYDVKWDQKNSYYKCKPSEAKKVVVPEFEQSDAEKKVREKNLGKCRHGILCAILSSGEKIDNVILGQINQLAEFSMTGEISEKSEKSS
jgi:hypothetical protein